MADKERKELSLLDTIQELLDRDPFVPFRIVTTSGHKYLVKNPHTLAIGDSQIFYFLPGDKFVFIRTNQLVAVENARAGKKRAA